MKPIQKRMAIFGLSALLISGAGTAFAFGGHKGHHDCHRGGGHSPMAALSQLEDLTDEQKQQLREIRKAARDAMREARDKMRDNRDELHDAMIDNADLETIRELADKQGDLIARMIVLRAKVRDKINSVLTESQREQFSDIAFSGRDFAPPPKKKDSKRESKRESKNDLKLEF
jgi:Spy/CpxP family protein refolding chaperone